MFLGRRSPFEKGAVQNPKSRYFKAFEFFDHTPHLPDQPISTVKTAWKATLRRAGVPHFPIYTLRHVFCTRLSQFAPDAVVQRAMRHTSPETKRRYQLGMTDQVRQAVEQSNEKAYGRDKVLRFYDVRPIEKKKGLKAACN